MIESESWTPFHSLHRWSLLPSHRAMLSQKVFLSLILCVFVGSLTVLPGCSESENTVVAPSSKEKREADRARGTLDPVEG